MSLLWKRSNKKPVVDSPDLPEAQSLHEESALTKTLHSVISDACKCADTGLWNAYARSVGSQPSGSDAGRLVFPKYRGKGLRVSEQEARFAFVEALAKGPLRYSVETPTSKRYSFSGKTPLSAQTDLQLHDESEIGICNVEFKAKGVSSSARDNFSIYKDVQKLMREPVWGLWFHLLEGIDNSTISKFLDVMIEQIVKVNRDFASDVETPGLTIHICTLRHGFSLHKDLSFPLDGVINIAELVRQLSVDLQVSRYELIEARSLNGWALHRQ